jgi:translocation and assembly module TamB
VTAAGVLPIFARQGAQAEAATNPLTVSVNNLDLNVQGLYQGGVSGDVLIGGTALSPDIGGTIQLNNGQVLIGQSNTAGAKPSGTQNGNATDNATTIFRAQPTNTQGTSTPDGATTTLGAQPTGTGGSGTPEGATTTFGLEQAGTQGGNATAGATRANLPPIEFDGLRLILGNNVRVSTAPLLGGFVPGGELSPSLLTFDAKGNLTINGTLAKPLPQGVIRLTGGRVSLFTTQFTLDRGYEHTAEFTPSRGLDPVLDVRLVTLVPEATGATANRTLRSPFSSEISDVSATSFGTLRTVRVQARATGPASQLAENLELTSEPSRSKAEIISLLGGSIINSLGQSDATTGLVTLAGSTIFGSLQGSITAIGQAIGFSEFRIYPSPVTARASRRNDQGATSSVLGLAAEGVFDISRNFSVSLSRVFLTNEPFNYNVIYRVNDDLLVRGSTNLADDSRLLFEYETRF